MGTETELKLRIDPRDASRIGHLAWLAGNRPKVLELANLYYDTVEGELAKRGIALRHRVIGRRWLITVKCREKSSGGLATRGEWEYPCARGELDFSGVDNAALQSRLEALRPRLVPLFSTDFRRRCWVFAPHAELSVEIAVDQGKITSGTRTETLCEVELELLRGTPHALFEIALDIAQRFTVLPENLSKAERGHRLYRNQPGKPESAKAVTIDDSLSPLEAFRTLAASCVDHLLSNLDGVRRLDDPEYVHQARVAIRRLRALFKVFAPLLPGGFRDAFAPAWKNLASLLGDARDLDVLVTETLVELRHDFAEHDGVEKFLAFARSKRDRAREAARMTFLGPEPGRLVIAFMAELTRLGEPGSPMGEAPAGEATRQPLKAFARTQLARRARRVRKGCAALSGIDIDALHRVRIQFKRLRYAVEFFAPLFKTQTVTAYLSQIKDLQDSLGRINDLERALSIESLAPDAVRSELIEGWLSATQKAEIDRLPQLATVFLENKAPWG